MKCITLFTRKNNGRWVLDSRLEEEVNRQYYENCVGNKTLEFFRDIGFKEKIYKYRNKQGKKVVKMISIGPNNTRTARIFIF